jgi:all-trans-retinol 13,14-reductase
MTNEMTYDVGIIGSGVGGLVCAAMLAKHGYRTVVIEKESVPGGINTSFTRGQFKFNAGVEDVSGLWEKGAMTYFLKEIGLNKEDYFVPNRETLIYKAMNVSVHHVSEDTISDLQKHFPGEKEAIERFFHDAYSAYLECYHYAHEYGTFLPELLIVHVFGKDGLINHKNTCAQFFKWKNKTFRQKLDEYFHSEDLKIILSVFLKYTGTDPEKASADAALINGFGYFLFGGYFPKGGSHKFSEAIKRFIEKNGGSFIFNSKVDGIIIENGQAVGIETGNGTYRCNTIVSDINAKVMYLDLIGEKNLDQKPANQIKQARLSESAFMVHLGIEADLSGYPQLIKSLDDDIEIIFNSNADPDYAPEGKSSVSLLENARYCDFSGDTETYIEKKNRAADRLIEKACRIIPEMRDTIIEKVISTPRTYERYAGMPEGAAFCFEHAHDNRWPFFKSSVHGLYLAGASTFPGAGIEAVTISGMIAANDIMGWKYKIGR